MNILILHFFRIKQYLLKNRLLFLLFLLGGILNTIAVTYCYGNLIPSVVSRNSQDVQYRNYTVVLNSPTSLETVGALLNDPLVEACAISAGDSIYACVYNSYTRSFSAGSGDFTSPYQITVPAASGYGVGDTVQYRGTEYTVIGVISSDGPEYVIPYETYLQIFGTSNIIRLQVLSNTHQDPDNDLILALLGNTFPNADYIGGAAVTIEYHNRNNSYFYFTVIAINAFLSSVSYTFLLHYILNSLRKENIITTILGIPKLRLSLMLFREAFFLSAMVIGLGLSTHLLLYDPLFTHLNLYSHIQYAARDYGIISLILLLLSLTTIIPMIARVAYVSPEVAKRTVL